MIISLDKLINVKGNKYLFTKGTNTAIDRRDNITGYPEDARNWKVVPTVMQMMLEGKVKFYLKTEEEGKAEKEGGNEE
ncbi:MAG TPA: hypothetical protein PKK43_16035 [Spirochaetota bacterium]|nr:hypothetical protein [Spirochaetota bacterium]